MASSAEVLEEPAHSPGGPRNIVLTHNNIYTESKQPHTSNHTKPPSQLSAGPAFAGKRGSVERASSAFQQHWVLGAQIEKPVTAACGPTSTQAPPKKQHLRRPSNLLTEDSRSAAGRLLTQTELFAHQPRQGGEHGGSLHKQGSISKQAQKLTKRTCASGRSSSKKLGGKNTAVSVTTLAKARGKDAPLF